MAAGAGKIYIMMRGDLVFLDTNVLLGATDISRSGHDQCRQVFQKALSSGIHLCLNGQVIREYLVVATRRVAENGLGLAVEDALFNIEQFRRKTVLLEETEAVSKSLVNLVELHGISGKRLHDANIAATMSAHRVGYLITLNLTDFDSFKEIECFEPEVFLSRLDSSE